jgi:hypothetical protein
MVGEGDTLSYSISLLCFSQLALFLGALILTGLVPNAYQLAKMEPVGKAKR